MVELRYDFPSLIPDLKFRGRKLVNGHILEAVYMDPDLPVMSLFIRHATGYIYLRPLSREMWEDDGMLMHIVNKYNNNL